MAVLRDSAAMIRAMAPERRPGRFVFVTVNDATVGLWREAIGSFREAEGLSLIVPAGVAEAAGLRADLPMACITLTVASALDGVGLTAAVAGALAGAGIPCNMVAAARHDHVFVPEGLADRALEVLAARAAAEP